MALHAYGILGYSLSNPSVSRTDPPLPEQESSKMERALPRDAQAACEFSLWISKFSPFFHRVSVMAAILRASVRRTHEKVFTANALEQFVATLRGPVTPSNEMPAQKN